MAFGERLQEVRRRAGLTQEQFAAELKVSRQAVSKWESCRGYPEIEKIHMNCAAEKSKQALHDQVLHCCKRAAKRYLSRSIL